jgi:hypothetical protein
MYRGRGKDREATRTGPVQIGALFEKYRKHLRPPQGTVIAAFCAVVASELDIALAKGAVRYTPYSRTIFVTAGGPEKTEILLNQKRLLSLCRQILGDNGTPEHIV